MLVIAEYLLLSSFHVCEVCTSSKWSDCDCSEYGATRCRYSSRDMNMPYTHMMQLAAPDGNLRKSSPSY